MCVKKCVKKVCVKKCVKKFVLKKCVLKKVLKNCVLKNVLNKVCVKNMLKKCMLNKDVLKIVSVKKYCVLFGISPYSAKNLKILLREWKPFSPKSGNLENQIFELLSVKRETVKWETKLAKIKGIILSKNKCWAL